MPLSRRVRILTSSLPSTLWFRAALTLCSLQIHTTRLLGRRDSRLQDALLLDYWLIQLTQSGPFAIPYTAHGAEHLGHTPDDKCGIVYAGVHLPCYSVAIRSLVDLDAMPDLAIAASVSIDEDGCYPLVGLKEKLPASPPGAGALLRTKRILSENGSVVSMLDSHIGMALTTHLLQLAGRFGARVVLFWTERDPSGAIHVTFAAPPFEVCDTEFKVQANLQAISQERDRIVRDVNAGVTVSLPLPQAGTSLTGVE